MFARHTRIIRWKCSSTEVSKSWCRQVFVLITRQFGSKNSQDDGWRGLDGAVLMNTSDKHYEEKKKTIEGFIEYLHETGAMVPDDLTTSEWRDMLKSCNSFPEYEAYLHELCKKQQRMKTSEERSKSREQKTQESQTNGVYGLRQDGTKNQLYLSKYIQGVNSGKRVIIDLNYSYCDTKHEELYKECVHIAYTNICHRQPLHLNFTGIGRNAGVFKLFQSRSGFFNRTSDCFEEDFPSIFHPRKNLVYLSPNGRPMPVYTGDEMFVIGGLTDRDGSQHLSLGRAKELGIRCASFPISHHGRQMPLKMETVFRVLLDLNLGLTWEEALSKYSEFKVRKQKVTQPQDSFVITV